VTPAAAARAARLAVAGVLAGALAGCATPPLPPSAPAALSGRIAVQVEAHAGSAARALSAGFELQGDASAGQLDLSTPLGTLIAQARWSAGEALLVTPQGRSRFPDLDSLTHELLGESLPVAALFDWLRGRPWPGAPSVDGGASGFAQLGWQVDLARFDEALVAVRRAQPPVVSVRARVDRP